MAALIRAWYVTVLAASLLAACEPTIRRVNISNSPTVMSSGPTIMTSGDAVHVAWIEADGTSAHAAYRVGGLKSSAFAPKIALGPAVGAELQGVRMALGYVGGTGSRVYVAIPDWPSGGGREIFLAVSPNGGNSFLAPANLSQSPTGHSTNPRIAAAGAIVALAWNESLSGGNEIHFVRSVDGAQTFGPVVTVSTTGTELQPPSVALVAGVPHVAYCAAGVSWLRRWPAGGAGFDAPERLTTSGATSVCGHEQLHVPGVTQTINSLWIESPSSGQTDVVLASSVGGAPVGSHVRLPNVTAPNEIRLLTWGASIGNIVYRSGAVGSTQIRLASTGTGGAFTTPVAVSTVIPADQPHFSGDHFVWRQGARVQYAKRAGSQFGQPERMTGDVNTNLPGLSSSIVSSADDDRYIVWREDVSPGAGEIQYYSLRIWRLSDRL